jgi:uncharacterized protein YprB with RNaseH-like and TPR domain
MEKKLKRSFKEIVDLMITKPVYIRMGKTKLASRFKCSEEDIVRARREANRIIELNKVNKAPKILIFDIETTPMVSYTWGRWNQNISLNQTIQESYMLCWSASWLNSNEVFGESLTPEEAIKGDDTRIIEKLWYFVNEADILVAYNGVDFDVKKINGMFFTKGLNPPAPYKVVDPCRVARSKFGFSSNSMDALAKYLGIPMKMDTDFSLWRRCMAGNKEALDYMLEYNKKDVEILKQIYIRMLPYITTHPNVCNYIDGNKACTHCGETENYEKLEGHYYYTGINKYQVYRCKTCGSIFRDRFTIRKDRPVVR